MATALLNDDGTSKIRFGFGSTRVFAHGVIESDGPRRETRLTHERFPRRYSLPCSLGDAADAAALEEALEESRGGLLPVSWIHPIDDAGAEPDTPPRYRILNALEAGVAVSRAKGGFVGSFTLELEALDP